jgi:lipoyl(octanoyl) transferase
MMSEMGKGQCFVCRLGLISFPDAMRYEHALLDLRYQEKIGDTLLIFEHPPTVTLGRFGELKNILLSPEQLENKGIAYYDSDRGGDATYNCPGQPVIHPIMNLRTRGARSYIANLQEVALRVVQGYGISAGRSADHPGLWVGSKQIAAIGLRLRHSVAMHGLSLNVNPDLSGFECINLCGLPERTATSIEAESGRRVSVEEVLPKLERSFEEIFGVELTPMSREELDTACFRVQSVNG